MATKSLSVLPPTTSRPGQRSFGKDEEILGVAPCASFGNIMAPAAMTVDVRIKSRRELLVFESFVFMVF